MEVDPRRHGAALCRAPSQGPAHPQLPRHCASAPRGCRMRRVDAWAHGDVALRFDLRSPACRRSTL